MWKKTTKIDFICILYVWILSVTGALLLKQIFIWNGKINQMLLLQCTAETHSSILFFSIVWFLFFYWDRCKNLLVIQISVVVIFRFLLCRNFQLCSLRLWVKDRDIERFFHMLWCIVTMIIMVYATTCLFSIHSKTKHCSNKKLLFPINNNVTYIVTKPQSQRYSFAFVCICCWVWGRRFVGLFFYCCVFLTAQN